MNDDIHKWTDGRYTLMFDEHTFFVWDNEKEERMIALNVTKKLNEQQATISALKEENEQLRQSVEYWQKKYEEGTETFTFPPNCDECDFLGNNGICGYCKFTLNCYDGKNDLVDGKVLPNCPFKYQEENKRLKKELDECEKFRYSIFKRIGEINGKD